MPGPSATSSGFGSTVWTLILQASQDAPDGADLNRLCQKYWRPVYVFVRRSGYSPADAEDATQEFFRHFLQREWIKQADPGRGRFRGFLHALLRNFLANYRRTAGAQKRLPAGGIVSLDTERGEQALSALAADADPARSFERSWAACLLNAAMEQLAREQADAGRSSAFAALRPMIGKPRAPGDYERAAELTGWPRSRVAVAIHRLGRRYAELIRIELAQTLCDGESLDAELRHLLSALAA